MSFLTKKNKYIYKKTRTKYKKYTKNIKHKKNKTKRNK